MAVGTCFFTFTLALLLRFCPNTATICSLCIKKKQTKSQIQIIAAMAGRNSWNNKLQKEKVHQQIIKFPRGLQIQINVTQTHIITYNSLENNGILR